jgi:hypothetical protein
MHRKRQKMKMQLFSFISLLSYDVYVKKADYREAAR